MLVQINCRQCVAFVLLVTAVCLFYQYTGGGGPLRQQWNDSKRKWKQHLNTAPPRKVEGVLKILVDQGIYHEDDFEANADGWAPPYWTDSDSNVSCQPKATTTPEWGPCFGTHQSIDWDKHYNLSYNSAAGQSVPSGDWAGYCRPGFLIIGAGKCGTSSLYHYLTDHPRVLPASEKQIHYFKYYSDRSMKWYLRHFPSARSFLSNGALITGEASPGYLPYPNVAALVQKRMPRAPRIIAIGREPIDRAYSSYRYNYVHPTIDYLKRGRVVGVPRDLNDTEYESYLFSFEEMMQAELATLKSCLADDGDAVVKAREQHTGWADEFERRQSEGLPPLADLDAFCYGHRISSQILRPQWSDLRDKFPDKVIVDRNLHLVQSMIGRSLYTLPLEWWYALFDPSQIYFVCTEELSDRTGEPLSQLASFLGLPKFNFSSTVQKGAYNVGGHRGYDQETSWTEVEQDKKPESPAEMLSEEFRQELQDFLKPYNERLFSLVGRRCNW